MTENHREIKRKVFHPVEIYVHAGRTQRGNGEASIFLLPNDFGRTEGFARSPSLIDRTIPIWYRIVTLLRIQGNPVKLRDGAAAVNGEARPRYATADAGRRGRHYDP